MDGHTRDDQNTINQGLLLQSVVPKFQILKSLVTQDSLAFLCPLKRSVQFESSNHVLKSIGFSSPCLILRSSEESLDELKVKSSSSAGHLDQPLPHPSLGRWRTL